MREEIFARSHSGSAETTVTVCKGPGICWVGCPTLEGASSGFRQGETYRIIIFINSLPTGISWLLRPGEVTSPCCLPALPESLLGITVDSYLAGGRDSGWATLGRHMGCKGSRACSGALGRVGRKCQPRMRLVTRGLRGRGGGNLSLRTGFLLGIADFQIRKKLAKQNKTKKPKKLKRSKSKKNSS